MKVQASRTAIWVGMSLAFMTACATDDARTAVPGQPIIDARDKLVAAVRSCTSRYAYDPDKVTGVSATALAPQELQWRQCAYDAARTYGTTNRQLSGMYEQLINEDIQMTTAIQQGSMTRSARRARNEQQLARIRKAEEQQINEAATAQDRQTQQVQQIVNGMRGFR